MDKLVRLIGPAPSELEHSELVSKIKLRQGFVVSVLEEFRNRMSGSRASSGRKKSSAPSKKAETQSLKSLIEEMRAQGISLEDLKKIARGEG